MTTAPKTIDTPELILVTDFFRDNGYTNSPPSNAYLRVNNRLNNGTYACLRITKYKRYITRETARQILAENPPTIDEPETTTEPTATDAPNLTLVTADTPADEQALADTTALRRDITLLTLRVGELTDAISELTRRLNPRK